MESPEIHFNIRKILIYDKGDILRKDYSIKAAKTLTKFQVV